MSYSAAQVWLIILGVGIGTFLIRISFLGPLGRARLPAFVMRLLRYTPVTVLPAMVAPMVVWPAATGGAPDPARLLAALAAAGLGYWTRNFLVGLLAGITTLYLGLYLL